MNLLPEKWTSLGITEEMVHSCRSPQFSEAAELIDAGRDMFDRPQRMTPATLDAWQAMQRSAKGDGISLLLVSAFRSYDYQCELIQRKLDAGQDIFDIIRVNTIPGFSEHHTGCALDLHDGVGEPLLESFEETDAFAWLGENAVKFRFVMSYPRGNDAGIIYEPWHWCYRDELKA